MQQHNQLTAYADHKNAARLLGRLRPVNITFVIAHCHDLIKTAKCLDLMKYICPNLTHEWHAHDDWSEIVTAVLEYTHASYSFHIDWENLEWLWSDSQTCGCDHYDCYTCTMYYSHVIEYIPFAAYGFNQEMTDTCEVLKMFAMFAHSEHGRYANTEALAKYEIFPDSALCADITWRLSNKLVFLDYDEPLCWLSEMAQIIRQNTGNPFLDSPYQGFGGEFQYFNWTDQNLIYLSDCHDDLLRSGVLDRLDKFKAWCQGQSDGQPGYYDTFAKALDTSCGSTTNDLAN